tara:strand:- start:138 stop:482 length:345 start_codon:yes stop_codon:yes gene_type:complete
MHPKLHAKSSVKKWGGKIEDYLPIHEWFDETKGWVGHSEHRLFRHHSEGIFQLEKIFGLEFTNSEDKTIYTRYVGEQHVKEDCFNYIPSAKEWLVAIKSKIKPEWMIRTLKLND